MRPAELDIGKGILAHAYLVKSAGQESGERGEENILALRVLCKGHVILYSPAICVVHKTKTSSDTSRLADYYRFRYQNYIRSYSIYLNMISNPGDVAKTGSKAEWLET